MSVALTFWCDNAINISSNLCFNNTYVHTAWCGRFGLVGGNVGMN